MRRGILLLGSSGTGKGTQARLLESRLGMRHLDFGNARRQAVASKSPVGRRIAALGDLISRGKFFDDDLATDLFVEALQISDNSSIFVLDGFPRNIEQIKRLRARGEIDITMAINLRAPFEVLLERIDGRLIHPPSGRTYHPILRPPLEEMIDDITKQPLIYRALSSELSPEAALTKRCQLESSEIDPLIAYLESEGLLTHIDATGSAEQVYASILHAGASCTPKVSEDHTIRHIDPKSSASVRTTYQQKGWVSIEGVFDDIWVRRLQSAVDEILSSSASSKISTEAFDVEEGHSVSSPMIRKIKRPHLWHTAFLAASLENRLLDVVEDLMDNGGGLRWQGDKIVIKMPHIGKHVVCHQDFAFYPHTNDNLCTVSVVLEDMTLEQGGLCYVSGSHRGPLYSHHDDSGVFVGGIHDKRFDPNSVTWEAIHCKAGSIIIHHARIIHASPRNNSSKMRPLLLLQYAANDAWPLQQNDRGAWGVDLPFENGIDEWTLYSRSLLRGKPITRARLAPVPVSLPIPWPMRGKIGALYNQLDRVECVMNSETANIINVKSSARIRDDTQRSIPPPSSNTQFKSLWDLRNSSDFLEGLEWQRLLQFVGVGPYGSLSRSQFAREKLQATLIEAVSNGFSDDDVYDALHECFHTKIVGSEEYNSASSFSGDRIQKRAEEMANLAMKCGSFDASATMLDIGCADGAITARIGNILGLSRDSIHGCDSKKLMQVGNQTISNDMIFTQLPPHQDGLQWGNERMLPYSDGSFNLVTALMTLHHVRRLKHLLDEVRRVLAPGGLLIIREHDCHSISNSAVVDIMHGMHHRTWAPVDDINYRGRGWLAENYEGYYQSAIGWNMCITAAGLSPHSVMGDKLKPYEEIVYKLGDTSGEPLNETGIANSLRRNARDQVVHLGDAKRVVFGVYQK